MFYEKVKEIYTTSVDYDKNAPATKTFFQTVQNKLEFAVVGKTAAEIIKTRADSTLPNMNLKTFKNVKKGGEIQKADVTIAKNYLEEKEIKNLNLLTTSFLDYAELQASKNRLMKMSDWAERVDVYLKFMEYSVLANSGTVKKEVADKFAEDEYNKYKVVKIQEKLIEFNKVIKTIEESGEIPKSSSAE